MFVQRPHGLDTLKLNASQQQAIAQFLEDRSRKEERRRAVRRYRFLDPDGLVLSVTHPGGTYVSYRVMPRDLSESGMGFLHGNFLYPGSQCTLNLRGKDGRTHSIPAKVMRCDHLTGRVHDVGIMFKAEINVTSYVDIEVEAEVADRSEQSEKPSYWRKSL